MFQLAMGMPLLAVLASAGVCVAALLECSAPQLQEDALAGAEMLVLPRVPVIMVEVSVLVTVLVDVLRG